MKRNELIQIKVSLEEKQRIIWAAQRSNDLAFSSACRRILLDWADVMVRQPNGNVTQPST